MHDLQVTLQTNIVYSDHRSKSGNNRYPDVQTRYRVLLTGRKYGWGLPVIPHDVVPFRTHDLASVLPDLVTVSRSLEKSPQDEQCQAEASLLIPPDYINHRCAIQSQPYAERSCCRGQAGLCFGDSVVLRYRLASRHPTSSDLGRSSSLRIC